MRSKPLLRRDLVVVPLVAETLTEGLALLTARLASAGVLDDAAAIDRAFARHTVRTAVRVAPAIALPHYRTDAVGEVTVALGVAPGPLRNADPDWQPGPRVVALVLAPTDATTAYLQAVSVLAGALRQAEVVERVLAARSSNDIFDIPALAEIEIRPRLSARDVMTAVVDAATPEMTVRGAVERMLRAGSRALVVVGEKGEVLGMVSEGDVMRGLEVVRTRPADDSVLPPLRVRDVMSRSVMCIADRAGLDELTNLMINKDVEEVPVVAEGKLVGVVRRADILRSLYGR